MTKENILHILHSNSAQIKSYGVDTIGLFGSYVRDEQTEKSDIDVIVRFKQGEKSYKKYINLVYFLEDLLHKKVDVLTFKGLSTNFKNHIEKEITYVSLGH